MDKNEEGENVSLLSLFVVMADCRSFIFPMTIKSLGKLQDRPTNQKYFHWEKLAFHQIGVAKGRYRDRISERSRGGASVGSDVGRDDVRISCRKTSRSD